jgi:RNA polymerase sigma-70 factor (ECF subfamily)
MNNSPDRELLQRVLDGRPDAVRAFAERVACVAPFLRRCAQRASGWASEGAIEDLAQETYLAIWRKLGSFEGQAKLETWACGFALIEFRRWREREARSLVGRGELQEEPTCPPAEVDDSSVLVEREIERIGPPTSDIIHLKHVENLTFEEIGARLELSPNTAKSLHYRGLARLRERLRGLEEGLAG